MAYIRPRLCKNNCLQEKLTAAYNWYIHSHRIRTTQQYAINSIIYLRTIKEKYILLYKELRSQLQRYAEAVRILTKGDLPNSLITPLKLKEILDCMKVTIKTTNPDYELVIKRLHLYYNMRLATSGIDRDRNLIIQFPVFIQLYTHVTGIISN